MNPQPDLLPIARTEPPPLNAARLELEKHPTELQAAHVAELERARVRLGFFINSPDAPWNRMPIAELERNEIKPN